MKAQILFVPAASDTIFPPELSRRAAERYRAQGGVAEVVVIEGRRRPPRRRVQRREAGRGDPRVSREMTRSRRQKSCTTMPCSAPGGPMT